MDGTAYDMGWDGSRIADTVFTPPLPSLSHSMYLIRSVQFHVGHTYHLFDEETFQQNLHDFYENPSEDTPRGGLWFVHYLLIMALGQAFVLRSGEGRKPPGAEFFVQAMKLLPDTSQLWKDTFTATELYCCAALYLQSTDYRAGAYLTVSLSHGLAIVREDPLTQRLDRNRIAHGSFSRNAHGAADRGIRRSTDRASQEDMVDNLYPRSGTVIAYGSTSTDQRGKHPRETTLPTVSYRTCSS